MELFVMSNEETNQLLHEIRDLLADREQKYDEHLEKTRQLYDSQLRNARRFQVRSILFVLMLFIVFWVLVMFR